MVAEGRALPPLPPSLLGLGIGVGKGWEVVVKYEIRGGEVGGRTRVRNFGEGRGVPKRYTLGTNHRNHSISPGRFWREKSFVSTRLVSLLLRGFPFHSRSSFSCPSVLMFLPPFSFRSPFLTIPFNPTDFNKLLMKTHDIKDLTTVFY